VHPSSCIVPENEASSGSVEITRRVADEGGLTGESEVVMTRFCHLGRSINEKHFS
jgi:hypothetical protein